MKKELISVIMPVFNAGEHLAEAIESVLDQDHKELEFIIVDDGSNDNSGDIIHSYTKRDRRIMLISKKNTGVADSLNQGIKKVSGDYVARMDSDDICFSNRLSHQLFYLQKHGLDLCGSAIEFFGARSRIKHYPETHDELITNLATYGKSIAHPTLFAKSEVLKNHIYSVNFPHAEDFSLWLDIGFGSSYRMGNCQLPLLKYRVHHGQISKAKKQYQLKSTRLATDYYLGKLIDTLQQSELNINYELSKGNGICDIYDLVLYSEFIAKLRILLAERNISPLCLDAIWFKTCCRLGKFGRNVYDIYIKNTSDPSLQNKIPVWIRSMLQI